mmetsp:Transcript_25084/g.45372  ORF Transcript_25084/g.45372 Transcript_25084/m.45372 type:complete len:236 (+) Transcript_25084:551-1258(+)
MLVGDEAGHGCQLHLEAPSSEESITALMVLLAEVHDDVDAPLVDHGVRGVLPHAGQQDGHGLEVLELRAVDGETRRTAQCRQRRLNHVLVKGVLVQDAQDGPHAPVGRHGLEPRTGVGVREALEGPDQDRPAVQERRDQVQQVRHVIPVVPCVPQILEEVATWGRQLLSLGPIFVSQLGVRVKDLELYLPQHIAFEQMAHHRICPHAVDEVLGVVADPNEGALGVKEGPPRGEVA